MKKNKNSINSLITAKVPLIYLENTLKDAQEILLKQNQLKNIETINYFYVIDQEKKLLGVFSIKELFRRPLETKVKEIIKKDLIKVYPKTDQEKVVYLALKNNIKSVPVVDKNNIFLGIITSDQILKILENEFSEDLLRLSGFHQPEEYLNLNNILTTPIKKLIKSRLPWLFIGLMGGILAAKIIGIFESSLEQNLILAMFIPVIVYMSNAVGGQTQILFIRNLTVNKKIPFLKYFLKEMVVCFFIALICSFSFFIFVILGWSTAYIAFVLSISMLLAIISAVLFSLIIPYLLNKFKTDPALGSGPFTTVIQDILSIIIYFGIANWLL